MSTALRTAKARLRQPQVKRSAPRKAPALDPVILLCRAHGLPEPMMEYLFAEDAEPPRRYRADYAWPSELTTSGWCEAMISTNGTVPARPLFAGVILEVQGGIWRSKGAHNTGTALLRDFDKFNLAQTLGFLVILATPQQVQRGDVLRWLKQVL